MRYSFFCLIFLVFRVIIFSPCVLRPHYINRRYLFIAIVNQFLDLNLPLIYFSNLTPWMCNFYRHQINLSFIFCVRDAWLGVTWVCGVTSVLESWCCRVLVGNWNSKLGIGRVMWVLLVGRFWVVTHINAEIVSVERLMKPSQKISRLTFSLQRRIFGDEKARVMEEHHLRPGVITIGIKASWIVAGDRVVWSRWLL